jgi:polysaccharide biosynthesis/export protein
MATAMVAGLTAFVCPASATAQTVEPSSSANAPSPATPEYVLQAGDQIEIKVANLPDLDNTVVIRPDGKISLLLLDDVDAAGRTPRQLDDVLTAGYAAHYREPKLTVVVRGFANLKVYVGGEVNQPSMVPLNGRLTAVGALFMAGGFRNTAKTDSVILIRNSGTGSPVAQRLNVKEILTKGKPDVVLQPFDVLYIPKTTIAKIDQFVDQYVKSVLPLNLNGGFTYIFGNTVRVLP